MAVEVDETIDLLNAAERGSEPVRRFDPCRSARNPIAGYGLSCLATGEVRMRDERYRLEADEMGTWSVIDAEAASIAIVGDKILADLAREEAQDAVHLLHAIERLRGSGHRTPVVRPPIDPSLFAVR